MTGTTTDTSSGPTTTPMTAEHAWRMDEGARRWTDALWWWSFGTLLALGMWVELGRDAASVTLAVVGLVDAAWWRWSADRDARDRLARARERDRETAGAGAGG